MYEYVSDEEGIKYNKENILKKYSQKDIFKKIFGFTPVLYKHILSPFREDKNPGCWFEIKKEKLIFRDFSFGERPIDCFDAIKLYYNIENFQEVLNFIKNNFNRSKKEVFNEYKNDLNKEIVVKVRKLKKNDYTYWNSYGITIKQIVKDKVFPIESFNINNKKNVQLYETCYVFTDFEKNKKKLYFPFRKKDFRFISNCKKNDIGNINNIPSLGRELVITKSYKDCRVLSNLGLWCIWLQSELFFPEDDLLIKKIKDYKKVIIWFDNDTTGIRQSKILSEKINNILPKKSYYVYLPKNLNKLGISDPSDLYVKVSKFKLKSFIKKYIN